MAPLGGDGAVLAVLLGAGVAGAAALALAAPLLTVEPFLWLEDILDHAPAGELLGALAGATAGLLISALVAILLLPLPWGIGLGVSGTVACASSTWGYGPARSAGTPRGRPAPPGELGPGPPAIRGPRTGSRSSSTPPSSSMAGSPTSPPAGSSRGGC